MVSGAGQGDAGRAYNKCTGVSPLRKSRTDYRHGLEVWHGTLRNTKVQPQHGALIHYFSTSCHGSIQNVRDKQCDVVPAVGCSHVPRSVDQGSIKRLGNFSTAVEYQQTTSLRRIRHAISGWKATDNHPATLESDQGCSQPDSSGTRSRQIAGVDLGKQADFAGWSYLHNCRAGSLKVRAVVEVADEDIPLNQ